MNNTGKLILSLTICQFAGVIGALFNTQSARTWYNLIEKPAFVPPPWVFGSVWLFLYMLMGVSLFLVWSAGVKPGTSHIAIALFAIQLSLNAAWSFFFFYLKSPQYGFIEILVLLFFIALTILQFYRIRPLAAFLLVPYFLWATFATYLSYSTWLLNR
ncbi:MAG: TspO/MBR family protein [Candidatus Omnitrophota bacterium]